MAPDFTLEGSFRLLFLYDVAEEIRLGELRRILGVEPAKREPSFRTPVPDYVRFERPPVVQPLEPLPLETGETLSGRLKYYDYGVVSLELELPFRFDWPQLIRLSSRWVADPDMEKRAAALVRQHLERARASFVRAYESRPMEDYYIIQLRPIPAGPTVLSAADLLATYGAQIAQIVRGEAGALSPDEQNEVLQGRISYYPGDLLVVAWTAAFVYDTSEGAAPVVQLLEYANTQLLEFRHYDVVLTQVLRDVYQALEKPPSVLARWRLARHAQRLNTIRLDVRELTEKMDTSIKFLSDMFYARLYRLAAAKIGVPDYRRLVDEKLRTGGDLYHFMMERFHQSSAFVLELMIVIILIIDLFFLFRNNI